MKIAFCTLGCKVNQYDTQAMRELFEQAGYEVAEFDETADIYLINTCTVTATGDKKSRQMVARAHAKNPNAKVIVAGCYSQRAPQEVCRLPGVNLVIGTKDRKKIVELVEGLREGGAAVSAVGELRGETAFETLSATRENRTRAQLKIQEGCDRYCAYCIIPYARGPLRSRAPQDIHCEIERLAAGGYCEVVLTGIHLMSYGKDLGDGIDLLSAIAQAESVPGIRRIRLSSLEPQLLSNEFVQTLAGSPKVCRQFHLSLQSGSPTVLRRMNRRYTPEEYAQCVQALRKAMPGCAITTDVIVGFPGESEAEFEETLEFVRRMELARIHVFPYSRREGTAAYAMAGQLPRAVKAARAKRLIEAAAALEQAYVASLVGTRQAVLLEEMEEGCAAGYTDTYVRVRVPNGGERLLGGIVPVVIQQAQGAHLLGNIEQ
ncbi:MAG: tRNA (N(6)-L-threonylcarbamoyladenosine(37)-C(2))-methylthiotransferase MtaB [Christensenellaceae bacterium]|jgi:threonylcarbamoyladenosine tRNA methylthiotransferase MtaB|nr:tRNA (N(6)-L-threonylcarbamoyladenosine(37)-C(2))-methylthiotransferase MtaB [Christensenellaceae bacterium]